MDLYGGEEVEFSTCRLSVGDTYLRLYLEDQLVAQSDDGCGSGLASKITYTVPGEASESGRYCLRAGCFGDDECRAWVNFFVYGVRC